MTVAAATPIDCAERAVDAAIVLARAFAAGRRLAIVGPDHPDHAHHVAVEFVHPVVAGARALPAAVVPRRELIPTGDVVLSIGTREHTDDITIEASLSDAEIVRSYHLLWELVHIALEHPGIVGSAAGLGGDSTGFLYPFLDAAESDEEGLREALHVSAELQRVESAELCDVTVDRNRAVLATVGEVITAAVGRGGRVIAMGNGGSATDAARFVRLLGSAGVPAQSLGDDYAIVTALANDLGAGKIFARQLDASARPGDVLFGWSTSGTSANLVAAFEQAHRSGVTCLGSCGYGGAAMTSLAAIDHVLAVDSMSVHRIQEAQAAMMSDLVSAIASGA